ncbi:Dual serine/threonine and tyrosine protein kinase, partial [Operophtera brumata]
MAYLGCWEYGFEVPDSEFTKLLWLNKGVTLELIREIEPYLPKKSSDMKTSSKVSSKYTEFLCAWLLPKGESDACCVLSAAWRRQVALHAAHSLSAHRTARIISAQILERLSVAHEKYQSALSSLETALASRLHHTEDIKLAIRKKYVSAFILCRGQYGVVYAAKGGWGGHAPVAIKSVLPADERHYHELAMEFFYTRPHTVVYAARGGHAPVAIKSVLPADKRHYHELAMEFFYTRSIPAHPRIVRLFGSIVQKGGMEGGGRSVLLVSERAVRDLHAAVRAGLSLATRMRIACDIIQDAQCRASLSDLGFCSYGALMSGSVSVLHYIKLKNVLLDAQCRASLSDLGFCSYGALMSGSVSVLHYIKLKNVLLDAQCRASLSDLGFCSYGALMSGS